jgi:hypothetical protein
VPYLLWRNHGVGAGPVDTEVDTLPVALLEAAGLPLDDFLGVSRYLQQHCMRPNGTDAPSGDGDSCPSSPEAAMLALVKQRLRPLAKGEGPVQ